MGLRAGRRGGEEPGRWEAAEADLARAPSIQAARRGDELSRAASFAPALFLTLLEGQEQLPSPGRWLLVIGERRDTDARASEPEMREDALTTLPAFGDALHDPAPYLWRGSRRPRGGRVLHTQSEVGARCAKPAHSALWARRALTACATMEEAATLCSRQYC